MSDRTPLRVLVLGAKGMLGSDIVAAAPSAVDVATGYVTGARIDITDSSEIARALNTLNPSVVINAAAYTKVDDAETNTAHAIAVNGTAVGMVGAACAARGIALVQFSTDYVFDGTGTRPYRENDLVSPINEYGRSKLIGEQLLQASGGEVLIVRTQWLFGLNGRSFPRTMWERALRGLATRVVSDQWGRPTFTEDLARATWRLIEARERGLLHVTNEGEAAWFDVARRIFAAAGVSELLSRCLTTEYPTPARRPAYSVLDTSRFRLVVGDSLPHWTDALDRFMRALRDRHSSVSV